jgi:hypothetical protein
VLAPARFHRQFCLRGLLAVSPFQRRCSRIGAKCPRRLADMRVSPAQYPFPASGKLLELLSPVRLPALVSSYAKTCPISPPQSATGLSRTLDHCLLGHRAESRRRVEVGDLQRASCSLYLSSDEIFDTGVPCQIIFTRRYDIAFTAAKPNCQRV